MAGKSYTRSFLKNLIQEDNQPRFLNLLKAIKDNFALIFTNDVLRVAKVI